MSAPLDWRETPPWPPDVFGAAAYILQRSGAYTTPVISYWPPKGSRKDWHRRISRIGREWRRALNRAPSAVDAWWQAVIDAQRTELPDVCEHRGLCEALLNLIAAADEACDNVGLPSSDRDVDFEARVYQLLYSRKDWGSSLGDRIHPSRLVILPKLHTPQSGMTVRSLSHHLAISSASEIRPDWIMQPNAPDQLSLNLLLMPWPFEIRPAQFKPAEPDDGPLKMDRHFGFFDYIAEREESVIDVTRKALEQGVARVGRIDGIVFPELSITEHARGALIDLAARYRAFLLAGVADPPSSKRPRDPGWWSGNRLSVSIPLYANPQLRLDISQHKHHRWCLTRSQIIQYGLGGSLDPTRSWWERSSLKQRRLLFLAMRPWLTMSVLVCEDLARQDPVSDLLRAVGPNLVIGLLMDGPQLVERWSARYATVLADDPGSSVLTLTSLGMAQLCRAPGKPASRTVALWKDAKSGPPQEIQLPAGTSGVILNLAVEYCAEYSADGRVDHGWAGYPILAGVHHV